MAFVEQLTHGVDTVRANIVPRRHELFVEFDAKLVQDVPIGLKSRIGLSAYAWTPDTRDAPSPMGMNQVANAGTNARLVV